MSSDTPYHEIAGLEGVYLEDSYVLGITEKADEISFQVEFVLTEQHPAYRPPLENEQHCYRRGSLTFHGVRDVRWARLSMRPSVEPNGDIDYGNIDAFAERDGIFRLEGEWGELSLSADTVTVSLPA